MPRQFKKTDTSLWTEQFGTGKDGSLNLTIPGTYNFEVNTSPFTTNANAFGTFTGTSGNTSGTASDAYGFWTSFVFVGDYVLIHQTQGTGAGNWELNVVTGGIPSSGGSSTVNLKYPLQNNYTTGCQIIKMPQFTSVTVGSSFALTNRAWNGTWGGVVAFFCNGTTTLNGLLSLNERGYRGGGGRGGGVRANSGENYNNVGSQTTSATFNGGGGGDGDAGRGQGGSGGGGGNGTAGANGAIEGFDAQAGAGGGLGTGSESTVIVFGGGGGGGGRSGSSIDPEGNGGAGGGLIFIVTNEFIISSTGGLTSNGGNGSSTGDAGGGGGAGGSMLIKSITANINTSKINSAGGSGGLRGGAGGTGTTHIDYASSYTGTSVNSVFSATQDSSLYPAGGSFIYNLL